MKYGFKKILALLLILGIISLEAFALNTSAEESELPSSVPLVIKAAIEDGEIVVTDELIKKINLCDKLYKGFYALESQIDISELKITKTQKDIDLLRECLDLVIESSDLFIAKQAYRANGVGLYSNSTSPYYLKVGIEYTPNSVGADGNEVFDRELSLAQMAEYEELARAIAGKVPQGVTDIEKILFLYDYIALNFEYDTDMGDESHDAYHFLTQKTGVCDAYSKAFNKVAEILGIPTAQAFSDVDAHAWTVVKIGKSYYHIDSTWSDPIPDMSGLVDHSCFLKSTAAFPTNQQGVGHRNRYLKESCLGLNITCDSNTYDNYLWSESITPFGYYNGEYYYIDDVTAENQAVTAYTVSAVIRKTKDFVTSTDVLKIDTEVWTDPTHSYLLKNYNSGLYMIGSQIYYNNADTLMYYDVESGKSGTVFKLQKSNITDFKYLGDGVFEYNEFSVRNGSTVFTKKQYAVSDMGLILNGEQSTFSENLIAIRKYISNRNSTDICLLKADISGNDGVIDVRDLIALKKLAIA